MIKNEPCIHCQGEIECIARDAEGNEYCAFCGRELKDVQTITYTKLPQDEVEKILSASKLGREILDATRRHEKNTQRKTGRNEEDSGR